MVAILFEYYKTTLIGGWGLAAASAALNMDWHAVIRDFGVLATMVFFFTWASWKREERMSARVSKLEDFNQNELLEVVKTTTIAISDNTSALDNLRAVLTERPCPLSNSDVVERLERISAEIESKKG